MNGLAIEPRYAVLLSEQVDPAHFTVTRQLMRYANYKPYLHKTTRHVRNMIHSVDDKPAVIRCYPTDKTLKSCQWYKYDVVHRDNDRPSDYFHYMSRMAWCRNGDLHRDGDRPAVMNTDSGRCTWYRHGILHRDGGRPADIGMMHGY